MIGVDLVKIERLGTMIERFGDKALKRFLSDSEIALVKNTNSAAGFWAAKEACSKALGCGRGSECGIHDMTISTTTKGAPVLTLSKKVTDSFGVKDTSLSITHDGDYAIAVVAIESSPIQK
jgi:holo-[acyl-carrier protein] synthase